VLLDGTHVLTVGEQGTESKRLAVEK
jgi:hypothetical protein